MTKISKNKNKVEGIRKRVGIFRSVQTILKRDQEKNSYSHSQIHVASHVRHQVQKSLADQLRSWALECHLKHSVLSKLLTILKLCGFNSLPKDSRTLLKTPKHVLIERKAGGHLWYNGIEKEIRNIFMKITHHLSIELNVSIDGLPLFKSSRVEFWPILANVRDMPHIKPFVIAIWCGDGKPKDLNEYLGLFVDEMNSILLNGISIKGYNVNILRVRFLADSPARSLMKGTIFVRFVITTYMFAVFMILLKC